MCKNFMNESGCMFGVAVEKKRNQNQNLEVQCMKEISIIGH